MKVVLNKSFLLLISSILLSAFLLSGCDSHSDYEKQIIRYLESNLKDPDSAKYKFERPLKVKINGQKADVILYSVNSKNSFGAYTGNKDRVFAFFYNKGQQYRNGDITEALNTGYYKIEHLNQYSDKPEGKK